MKFIMLTIALTLTALGIGFAIGYVTKKDKFTLCDSSSATQTTASSTAAPTRSTGSAAQTSTSLFPSTTTTTPAVWSTCPPTLPSPSTSTTLWSVDNTVTLTAFSKYSLEYTSPAGAASAMLVFEFSTNGGSWYLDDVSVKEQDASNRELIDNGGFETGNLGTKWKSCDPRYPWIVNETVVSHTSHSDSYSCESKDPGAGSQEYLTQTFNIEGRTKYTIKFYTLCRGDPISATATIISA